MLTGLLLLLVFTAAVSRTLSPEAPGEELPASVDMVVVGSGLPALTAALQAALLGAEVLLLDDPSLEDQLPPPLGGRFVAYLPEEEEGAPEANGQLLEAVEKASPGLQRGLLTNLLSQGRDTLEWLRRETGLPLPSPQADRHHIDAPFFRNPKALQAALGDVLYPRLAGRVSSGKPLEIQMSASGEVEGLFYRDGQGREHNVTARAVVLAPGGYLGHKEFMEHHSPELAALPLRVRQTGITGLAYDLTRPLRGRLANPEGVYAAPYLYPPEILLEIGDIPDTPRGAWLAGDGTEITARVEEALSAGEKAFLDLLLEEGGELFLVYPAGQAPGLSNLGYAGSPGELQEFTGISRDRLEGILDRLPLPYALGRVVAECLYSLGGLATDGRGRVLGPLGPLPGLYALGEAAGSLLGAGMYPGLPLTEALVMGRQVGREAALYSRR